ncbi:hypothetical protein FRC06_000062 [Ceratobasidium sp. 370]|nr:hypothetical protein FRC06_000062 [Ceratobasidium sp. 370]
MGSCLSNNSDPEALKKHREVEKELKAHAKKRDTQVKVLLLGSGDSGKSTVLKQMRVIHNDQFTPQEIESYRQLVFSNIVRGLQMLLDALPKLDSSISPQNAPLVALIRSTPELRDDEPYPEQLLQPLQAIWGDPQVQQGWLRANEVALPEKISSGVDPKQQGSLRLCSSYEVMSCTWSTSVDNGRSDASGYTASKK